MLRSRSAMAQNYKDTLNLPRTDFDGLLEWVLAFRRRLSIPQSLAEAGVQVTQPGVIGREAAIDPSAGGNPLPTDAATYERLFRSAVKGDLTLAS